MSALFLLNITPSFEFLFLCLGISYDILTSFLYRSSVGEILLGVRTISKNDKTHNIILLINRKIIAKWIISIVLPILLLKSLFYSIWIDSIHTFYYILILLFINLILLLFFKKNIYDFLTNTKVITYVYHRKQRKKISIVSLLINLILLLSFVVQYLTQNQITSYLYIFQNTSSTDAYTSFLEQTDKNPKAYILDKFKEKDIVVLCERSHPEATQWDFINSLVQDSIFINKVGLIYTEYGHIGVQNRLDSLLTYNTLDTQSIKEKVLQIVRNDAVWPYSDLTASYKFILNLALFNQKLDFDKKIRCVCSDYPINWDKITQKEYLYLYTNIFPFRDSIMAYNIIHDLSTQKKSQKCLIIMNYYHAMNLNLPQLKKSVFYYLKKQYKDKVCNILINSRGTTPFFPIKQGIWDRAFKKINHRPLGFDFYNSPFGKDRFDLLHNLKVRESPFKASFYQDKLQQKTYDKVFDGFVYLNPIEEQYFEEGIPGYFDSFKQKSIQRCQKMPNSNFWTDLVKRQIQLADKFPIKRKHPALAIESLIELGLLIIMNFMFGIAFLYVSINRSK